MRKLTTEEFVRKAREKHTNKFGYEKVVYINDRTKVLITCQTCDEDFLQTPSDHLQGRGCPGCKFNKLREMSQNKRKKTASAFITRAIKVHGEKYGYENVVYVDYHTYVQITCLTCDEDFSQTPGHHLAGKGCPTCAIRINAEVKKKKAADTFISRAVKVHGEKFGYEKTNYITAKIKVCITCLVCNKDFLQTPAHHLSGNGCPSCKFKKLEDLGKIRRGQAAGEFIEKATKVHGKKYGYEKTNYISASTDVSITCLVCDKDFLQTPNTHLCRGGCPTCANRIKGEIKKKRAADTFISRAVKVHGKKYGYEKTNYITARRKVCITCLVCNKDFLQTPNSHLRGTGCPKCVNKTEEIVASKLHEILGPLGFEVEQTGRCVFDGIGRMDITITKEDLVIFVEVDGLQHFEYVKQFRSEAIDVQKRDLEKHMRAIERGHKVIRIDQDWVWNSQAKNIMEWASRLYDTIVKLDSGTEPSIDEMFISDRPDKYHDHLCYIQCQF